MKSLRILHTESSLALGGQELRILSEAVGMRQRGHAVFLVVQPGSLLADHAGKLGIPTTLLKMSMARFAPLLRAFLLLITRHHIDVIHTHGSVDSWVASIAGRLSARKPLVIRARHKSTPVSDTIRHRWLYGKLAHAVVVTGEAIRRRLISKNHLPASHVISIPTGVDLSRFLPGQEEKTLREEWGLTSDERVVGTVAFFRDYKGLFYFLQAARIILDTHPSVKFFLVGGGPDQEQLERRILELNLTGAVRVLGFRADIPQVLEVFDVFVLPSIGGEGVPQALMQAMAMERAVVATDIGGIPEVVQHGVSGYLIEPRDARALAEKVCVLLDNDTLRRQFGRSGRAFVVNHYSLVHMLDQTERFYERLIKEHAVLPCRVLI